MTKKQISDRQYYEKNTEALKKKGREYYYTNHELRLQKKRDWYEKNKEKRRAVMRAKFRGLKETLLAHYGNKCACCKETIFEFLSIDHIAGGGRKHRLALGNGIDIGSQGLYTWIIKNNFPEGFQILCFNCNVSKSTKPNCAHIKYSMLPSNEAFDIFQVK